MNKIKTTLLTIPIFIVFLGFYIFDKEMREEGASFSEIWKYIYNNISEFI